MKQAKNTAPDVKDFPEKGDLNPSPIGRINPEKGNGKEHKHPGHNFPQRNPGREHVVDGDRYRRYDEGVGPLLGQTDIPPVTGQRIPDWLHNHV